MATDSRSMIMLKLTSIVAAALLASVALAQEAANPIGDETKAAEQGTDKVETETVTAAVAPRADELVLPAGFKKKKRGDLILYCIRGKATGTRFQTESCYDEPGLKDYILKREASNREFEQNRAICSNPSICAP